MKTALLTALTTRTVLAIYCLIGGWPRNPSKIDRYIDEGCNPQDGPFTGNCAAGERKEMCRSGVLLHVTNEGNQAWDLRPDHCDYHLTEINHHCVWTDANDRWGTSGGENVVSAWRFL